MDHDELADVIARAQRREPEAFDALVEAYGPRLYGYFYRLTGRRHEAEDLLQEAFVRLVRTIGRYHHMGRFDQWLFRIAINLTRDRMRRSAAARRAGIEEAGGFSAENPGPGADERADPRQAAPQDALGRAEEVDRLQQALGQLSAAEREVIVLRHFSGMSFREIAQEMGTPLGTALARAHRGLGRLRELLGPPG